MKTSQEKEQSQGYYRTSALDVTLRELHRIKKEQSACMDSSGSVVPAFRYKYQLLERERLQAEENLKFMQESRLYKSYPKDPLLERNWYYGKPKEV